LITTTSEYALRALIHIARRNNNEPVLAREIAADTGIPNNYLSKILRELVRVGILGSTRGIGGGFRMLRPASELHLADLLAPFEGSLQKDRCPFGHNECSDDHPCAAHEHWRPLREAYIHFMDRTTLAQIAAGEAGMPGRPSNPPDAANTVSTPG
jgi:Rrf2 family protein